MSNFRFGLDDYGLDYYPPEASDGDGGVDWGKVEGVEIEWHSFVRLNGKSRWHELFGTPERAARSISNACEKDSGEHGGCGGCPVVGADCGCGDYDALLEWLRGESDGE